MSHFHGLQLADEVIRAARAGEAQAHESIYRACQRPVYTLIRRLIPRPAIADELLQEVFVEILRNIGSYSGEGPFGGWVRSIALNKCLMYLRSPWHRSLLWLDQDADGAMSADIRIDTAVTADASGETRADLERALATLPALTRSVVWLHDVEGYTHGEIARALGRTISFSKSQLARAHHRLRQLLDSSAAPGASAESLPCTPVSTNC